MNALMSERRREREREREKRKEMQCRERERARLLGSKPRRKLQKFCLAKASTTVDFNLSPPQLGESVELVGCVS